MQRIRPAARCAVVAVALAGLVSVAAACGDDNKPAATTAASTATRAATTTTTTASSPATAATTAAAVENVVRIADNSFSPNSLTVKAGSKVTWNWGGSNPHSVVFANNGPKSDVQTAGRFETTLATAGTFQYQCGVHGASMTGTIVVN